MEGPKKTHFACAVIWRKNEVTREIEFLVIESVSTKNGKKSEDQIKFPGGMNRVPDESVQLTLQREVLEETHMALLPSDAREIWSKLLPVDPETGEQHTKYGFLVAWADCRGILRTEVLKDNGDEMSAPRWEPVSVLKHSLFPGHQPALLKAMEHLGLF